jgi:hypothetical protein
VKTSADTEVIHEMIFPPQHNHMGELLPVPYDQLAVGQYTTREIVAERDDVNNGSSAVAAFNQEVDTTQVPIPLGTGTESLEKLMTDSLSAPGVALPITSLNFSTVPADAPALKEALAGFQELIDENDKELRNAWGTIIVTQNQNNLKRIDVIITWDEVQLDGGIPVLDANGNSILVLDENGNPKRRLNIDHLFIHKDGGYFAH